MKACRRARISGSRRFPTTPEGAIYEVDLLVLTKQWFWLVEIKSWPGRAWGDAGTWSRTLDGKTISEDNPVMLASRKAKALSSSC